MSSNKFFERGRKNLLGILGGMGPLSSAEFLKTIYQYSLRDQEQLSPAVIMLSDPGFPDRTDDLLAGSYSVLLERLKDGLHILRQMGATETVICCITIHYLVPRLPDTLREGLVSLIDVIFAKIAQLPKKHLLICTNGTRNLKLFQSHLEWKGLEDRIVWPDESDQSRIHYDLIYQIKKNRDIKKLIPLLELLLVKYKVDSFIAGCTELHFLAKYFADPSTSPNGYSSIDPLSIIARELAQAD
jgi:aspartate racemase